MPLNLSPLCCMIVLVPVCYRTGGRYDRTAIVRARAYDRALRCTIAVLRWPSSRVTVRSLYSHSCISTTGTITHYVDYSTIQRTTRRGNDLLMYVTLEPLENVDSHKLES